MTKIRILAISGSLREFSYNSALIKAAALLAPDGMEVIVFDDLKHIPLFNPDRENDSHQAVNKLKTEVSQSDGLLISSPEYAHGISGVLKNALDWLVSGEEFPDIPVALANTSPRATHAQAALREVVSTMSGNIMNDASISVPLLGSNYDANTIVKDVEMSGYLIQKLTIFRNQIVETS